MNSFAPNFYLSIRKAESGIEISGGKTIKNTAPVLYEYDIVLLITAICAVVLAGWMVWAAQSPNIV